MLTKRKPELSEAYSLEMLEEDAGIGVLLMWMYAICVSIPILSHHAAAQSDSDDANDGSAHASGGVDSSSESAVETPVPVDSDQDSDLHDNPTSASTPLAKLKETILTLKVALREHDCPAIVERMITIAEACGSFYY